MIRTRFHKTLALLLASLPLFAACDADFDVEGGNELVVEGWIDSGGFPVVKLTRTLAVGSDYRPTSELSDCIERWAVVRVSDGERTVTLVGHSDDSYYPPYVYTTSEMRGVPGRTYRLTVECLDGTRAEAEATIPPPASIDSFSLEPVALADTLCQLYAYVGGGGSDDAYYKLFTCVLGKDFGLMSAYFGIASGAVLPADGRMAVSRGRENMEFGFSPYFTYGDRVMVKLARIDSTAYAFWRGFEDMADLSRNPLFPVTNNLRSNIRGGFGYWFGYGSCTQTVVLHP